MLYHAMKPASKKLSSALRVLIVDDSLTLRQRMAEMLARIDGLEIAGEAGGVEQARLAIRELQPDVIILDLQMGDGNGMEIMRETKLLLPSIRIIVFTNHPELQYRQRCLDLGADYFFCKSTDARSLISISEILVAATG